MCGVKLKDRLQLYTYLQSIHKTRTSDQEVVSSIPSQGAAA